MINPLNIPFKYYLIRSNKLADASVIEDGELSGIIKIPYRYRIWHGRYIDAGDLSRITEPEYSTYEAFGITVYKWITAEGSLRDGFIYVYAYNPESYEVVVVSDPNGRMNKMIEPKRT